MLLKFIMRDANGEIVPGTPTVSADGSPLSPEVSGDGWKVDAPMGSLVTATLVGAVPMDKMLPTAGGLLDTPLAGHDLDGTVGDALTRLINMTPDDDWVSVTEDTVDVAGVALGSVVDSATRLPVQGCDIVAYLDIDADRVSKVSSTTSDISGNYRLRVPPGARYTIVFRYVSFGEFYTTVEV